MSSSISSISSTSTSTSSVTAVSAVAVAGRPAAPGSDSSATAAPQGVDASAEPLAPARFPWLSRLSLELESAARQTARFAAAPELGDHLNQST